MKSAATKTQVLKPVFFIDQAGRSPYQSPYNPSFATRQQRTQSTLSNTVSGIQHNSGAVYLLPFFNLLSAARKMFSSAPAASVVLDVQASTLNQRLTLS
jgi:hypothetical protein